MMTALMSIVKCAMLADLLMMYTVRDYPLSTAPSETTVSSNMAITAALTYREKIHHGIQKYTLGNPPQILGTMAIPVYDPKNYLIDQIGWRVKIQDVEKEREIWLPIHTWAFPIVADCYHILGPEAQWFDDIAEIIGQKTLKPYTDESMESVPELLRDKERNAKAWGWLLNPASKTSTFSNNAGSYSL